MHDKLFMKLRKRRGCWWLSGDMPTGLSLGGNFAGKLGVFPWNVGKAALSAAAGAAAVWYTMTGRPPP